MIQRSIDIGPFTIHFYGLIIAIAIFSGWLLAKKRASAYKIPQTLFDDSILLVPLILGIIGARLYHVADYWHLYRQDLLSILKISSGGLGIWGSLAGIFIGFWIVSKVKRINLLSFLDLASPSLILGQALGRIGNFINQEGFGPPTTAKWGVFISPENRPTEFINSTHFHPTFFYEATLDGLFFVILLYMSKRLKVRGQLFASYLILYATGRFIAEFWRIDTWTIGVIKVAHLLSVCTMIIGITIFFLISKTKMNQVGSGLDTT